MLSLLSTPWPLQSQSCCFPHLMIVLWPRVPGKWPHRFLYVERYLQNIKRSSPWAVRNNCYWKMTETHKKITVEQITLFNYKEFSVSLHPLESHLVKKPQTSGQSQCAPCSGTRQTPGSESFRAALSPLYGVYADPTTAFQRRYSDQKSSQLMPIRNPTCPADAHGPQALLGFVLSSCKMWGLKMVPLETCQLVCGSGEPWSIPMGSHF